MTILYSSNSGTIVKVNDLENLGLNSYNNFLSSLKKHEVSLDSFAESTRNGDMIKTYSGVTWLEQTEEAELYAAYEVFKSEFSEKYGLGVELFYHDKDGERTKYDDMDMVNFVLDNKDVFKLTAKAKKLYDILPFEEKWILKQEGSLFKPSSKLVVDQDKIESLGLDSYNKLQACLLKHNSWWEFLAADIRDGCGIGTHKNASYLNKNAETELYDVFDAFGFEFFKQTGFSIGLSYHEHTNEYDQISGAYFDLNRQGIFELTPQAQALSTRLPFEHKWFLASHYY